MHYAIVHYANALHRVLMHDADALCLDGLEGLGEGLEGLECISLVR